MSPPLFDDSHFFSRWSGWATFRLSSCLRDILTLSMPRQFKDSSWSIRATWLILMVHLVLHTGFITHSKRQNAWGQPSVQTTFTLTDVHRAVQTIKPSVRLGMTVVI